MRLRRRRPAGCDVTGDPSGNPSGNQCARGGLRAGGLGLQLGGVGGEVGCHLAHLDEPRAVGREIGDGDRLELEHASGVADRGAEADGLGTVGGLEHGGEVRPLRPGQMLGEAGADGGLQVEPEQVGCQRAQALDRARCIGLHDSAEGGVDSGREQGVEEAGEVRCGLLQRTAAALGDAALDGVDQDAGEDGERSLVARDDVVRAGAQGRAGEGEVGHLGEDDDGCGRKDGAATLDGCCYVATGRNAEQEGIRRCCRRDVAGQTGACRHVEGQWPFGQCCVHGATDGLVGLDVEQLVHSVSSDRRSLECTEHAR